MIFPLFWLISISCFLLNYLKTFFLSTVNKYTITIMIIIIIINIKSFQKIFFCGISIHSENKLPSMKKFALNITTLKHCKATQVLCGLFSTNQWLTLRGKCPYSGLF